MSIEFGTQYFPPKGCNIPFGFVQKSYKISNINERSCSKEKCEKCTCYKFPIKNGGSECPICVPSADFIEGSVFVGNGSRQSQLYFLVIDLSFPHDISINILKIFIESLDSDDLAVVFGVSEYVSVLFVKDSIPICENIVSPSDFVISEQYELNRSQLSGLLDAIPAFSRTIPPTTPDTPLDVVPAIQCCIDQAMKRPYIIFFMSKREIKPLPAEKAAVVGKAVFSSKGIIHFGNDQSFKRLTAIAHHSFGCVFGISKFVSSTFSQLRIFSRIYRMKVYSPRFIEASKVTGADGSVRMTAKCSVLKFRTTKGCSCRLNIDYSRIGNSHSSHFYCLEAFQNSFGYYLTLHKLSSSPSIDTFSQNISQNLNKSLLIKGYASDILRMIWTGEDMESCIRKHLKQNPSIVGMIAETCLNELGSRPDRDTLKLYYVLHSLLTSYQQASSVTETYSIHVMPPFVFFHGSEDPINVISNKIESEWPYELNVFTDISAFKLVVEKIGVKQ